MGRSHSNRIAPRLLGRPNRLRRPAKRSTLGTTPPINYYGRQRYLLPGTDPFSLVISTNTPPVLSSPSEGDDYQSSFRRDPITLRLLYDIARTSTTSSERSSVHGDSDFITNDIACCTSTTSPDRLVHSNNFVSTPDLGTTEHLLHHLRAMASQISTA